MDGFEAVEIIRQQTTLKNIPIIAVSASAFETNRQQSQLAGCDAFLSKPVQMEQLLGSLAEYLPLKWLYAPEQSSSTIPSELTIPPLKELQTLHELAMQGKIYRIRKYLSHLETLDEQYIPFAKKVRILAQGFKRNEILELLTDLLDKSI